MGKKPVLHCRTTLLLPTCVSLGASFSRSCLSLGCKCYRCPSSSPWTLLPLPRPSCPLLSVLMGEVSHAGAPTLRNALREGYIKFLSLSFGILGHFTYVKIVYCLNHKV